MIVAPTPCYFTGLAVDEAAQLLMMEISPAAAADITELTLVSIDFDSDIEALNNLDITVNRANTAISGDVSEVFNPLYVPSEIEDVDNLLDLHLRSDSITFTGFAGDPFTVKMVDIKRDEMSVVTFTARHHPFELPSYTEIVDANDRFNFN